MAAAPSRIGWTVWSVWRGDRAKLARIARSMESCYSPDRCVCARVDVDVLSDHESYESFASFADEAPAQTTSKFDALRIEAIGPEGDISVELRQRGEPGVTLTVEPADGTGAPGSKGHSQLWCPQ